MSWVILLLVVVGVVVIALTPVARAASRSRSGGEPQETSRRPLPRTGETGGEPPPGSQRYRDEDRGRPAGDT